MSLNGKANVNLADATVIVATSLLLILGFTIYLVNRASPPILRIHSVSFRLDGGERRIEFYVEAIRGDAELLQLFINGETAYGWQVEDRIISEGESVKCVVEYPWMMGEKYTVKLVSVEGSSAEIEAVAPILKPSLELKLKKASLEWGSSSLKVEALYEAESRFTSTLQLLLFTYRSYVSSNRSIYAFYDHRYMAEESLKRVEAIIEYFKAYNLTVHRVSYSELNLLSKLKPNIILVIVNPLKDGLGRRVYDCLPAPLIDPDGDGYIRDDSKYGRSLLYDWMKDNGLILVTVGSVEPYKRIVYEDGVYRYSKDSREALDAHLILADAHGEEPIVAGGLALGRYSPTRITCTLGISHRDGGYALDKDAMEVHGLRYYGYGDYKFRFRSRLLNLTLPVFLRVGRGGWLHLDDRDYRITDWEIAHDLFMIYLQAVWDSDWIPYGWYWDSGTAFYAYDEAVKVDGRLETEWIPSDIVGGSLTVRIVAVSYSSELNAGLIKEETIKLKIEKTNP